MSFPKKPSHPDQTWSSLPDPEVAATSIRRCSTAEHKLRILALTDACIAMAAWGGNFVPRSHEVATPTHVWCLLGLGAPQARPKDIALVLLRAEHNILSKKMPGQLLNL
ncbi:MAG: hypothetical protein ABIU05_08070 [Nitrospirales bacterium]